MGDVNLRELRQERAALRRRAEALLEKAEAEGRDLTPEESAEFERLTGEVEKLTLQIEREERARGGANPVGPDGKPQPIVGRRMFPGMEPGDELRADGWMPPVVRAALERTADPEYRAAFWRAVRGWPAPPSYEDLAVLHDPAVRSLVVAVGEQGGYLAPVDFERQVVQALAEENVIRQVATVQRFANDREVPIVAAAGAAQWIGEQADYPVSDPSFAQARLGAHKLARIILVSEELLQDSAVDLEALLRGLIARSFGEAEEAAFVAGDGNGKPRGVLLDCQVGRTAASSTAVTGDELIDLAHSLRPPYRRRAVWVMNDETLAAVRKLKDNTGQFLWQPGLRDGEPDRLLGRPVLTTPAMPPIGGGARSILFGDFSYYWIADRTGLVLQVLRERYAEKGQIGFKAMVRVDGRLMVPEAVKALEHPS